MVQKYFQRQFLQVMSLLFVLLGSLPAVGGEPEEDTWAQFRGQNRDGISHSKNLLTIWPEDGPAELWRLPLGSGFSGFAVDEDKFYTMMSVDSTEYIACFRQSDASQVWQAAVGKMFVDEFGNGPRSTPAVDETSVYALGSTGVLHAFDKNTGEKTWEASFPELFKTGTPRRGFSMSPLLDGDRLIIETGGLVQRKDSVFNTHLVAFQKSDGSMIWQQNINPGWTGYSSALKMSIENKPYYIFLTSNKMIAVSEKGDVKLEAAALQGGIGMPVLVGADKVFMSSSTEGAKLMQIKASGDSLVAAELWINKNMRNHFNSSVYVNGHIYGFNNATFTCLDAESGERQWRKRGLGKGSLVASNSHLYVLSDKGALVLVEANGTAYTEISRFSALEGKSWTAPTLVGGKVYLRNLSEMACYNLGKSTDF